MNQANLIKLGPADSAVKYVEVIGGPESVVKKGQQAFDKSEYRCGALSGHFLDQDEYLEFKA